MSNSPLNYDINIAERNCYRKGFPHHHLARAISRKGFAVVAQNGFGMHNEPLLECLYESGGDHVRFLYIYDTLDNIKFS